VTVKALFLDAGNTLLFPALERTLAPLAARGIAPTVEQLHASERFAKERLDAARLAPGVGHSHSIDAQYWERYYAHLLTQLNISDSTLVEELVANSRISANWSRVLPGTGEVLARLATRFRLGVISNSDGRIEEALRKVGLADNFDTFTDSGNVGYEKPHPAIFAAAVASMGSDPAESIYIGDIYSVDYLGAKAAGMQAILMDVCGAYRDRDVPRIENLAELESKIPLRARSAT
jgi:HAD superfamily hydrolase (TIGR01509 family)